MIELHPVDPDHETILLRFERENRAYFAESITDRGDDFFEQFAERHRELLAQQETGTFAYYVLLGDDGNVVGRFNLYDITNGTANVGYRVAREFSGSGVATSGLMELCRVAREKHALRTLSATTSDENIASQKVLAKAGFVAIEPAVVAGRRGVRYELHLEGL